MFRFFLPTSKVQKDRQIMRETDARMAKYSRRGLIFNFLAFLLCTTGGRFMSENRDLMITLTVGLLLITLLRGYYLFRFDHLYPRAPAKWRNHYFVATLIGAMWWGFIMVSVTLSLKMEEEAPVLWLYTVIFFSATAHAFAPYQKFLTAYQFFGLIPAAIAAVYVHSFDGYLYSSMMFVFYLVLSHQCRLISENYWERLEAIYVLARKTQTMEEEKRDSRANARLNQEFLQLLHGEFKMLLKAIDERRYRNTRELKQGVHDEIENLCNTIGDFNGVNSKKLALNSGIFNIRHEIQHVVAEYVDQAEQRATSLETALSPTLPMRLQGDASRVAQIIRSLLDIVLAGADNGVVVVEVEFLREYESAGELYITVGRHAAKSKKKLFGEERIDEPKETLSLIVAKGLADMMDGSIEYSESTDGEQRFRFNAKLEVAELAGQLDFHKNAFVGQNVLLVGSSSKIVDIKRQELSALGFNVFCETQHKRAIQTLLNSYKFSNPIVTLLYYYEPQCEALGDFTQALLDNDELKFVKKIVAATRAQQAMLRAKGYTHEQGFYYVDKPTGLFELECVFHSVFDYLDEGEARAQAQKEQVVLLSANPDQGANWLPENPVVGVADAKHLLAAIKDGEQGVVLLDCDTSDDVAALVSQVRLHELAERRETLTPIIGVSAGEALGEVGFEQRAYELGLDDFVDLSNPSAKSLAAAVHYWGSLK